MELPKPQIPGKKPYHFTGGGIQLNIPPGSLGSGGLSDQDVINILMRINPNYGGAIDPAPFASSVPMYIPTQPN
jgi:hypothetical protein